MNRVIARARILLALILVLSCGMLFFVGEFLSRGKDWILFAGSPHVYNAGNIGCGVITDRNGALLLDLLDGRSYSELESLRRSTVHWLGDRAGNVSAPAISHYAEQIVGFDPLNGLYAYGGIGGQVQLTLSAKVQMAALEAMGDYTGTVAVYNYKTGELLCAVTTPNFDPENPPDITDINRQEYEGLYLNRFIQTVYTPGSIYKIVTAAAALETIPDIQQQKFTCDGSVSYGVDCVTCEQSHGELDFREAFARSCNCAFALIADQLGGEVLQRYATQFGLTDHLRFDGITSAAGSLQSANAAAVQVAWSAIGQHKDLVNPCGFMTFLGAIAMGGKGVNPHVVAQISNGSDLSYEAKPVEGERIMSTSTAEILRAYLRNNVENYYGDENFLGLRVCAKSGTAEVGGGKKPNAMFTGFVEDDKYPLAFIVAIEDGGYGRQVCVPVISKILSACMAEIQGI